MSTLDVPRIHFAGKFYADPSTVNNDPRHYDPDETRPSPWQEPMGKHHFDIVDCTVRSVLDARGRSRGRDPLVGAAAHGTNEWVKGPTGSEPVPAKIVDLDVYQQAVTEIYGFELELALPDGQALRGKMSPPPALNDSWFKRVRPVHEWTFEYGEGGYGQDTNASGVFQTQLRVPEQEWPKGSSPVLDQLRAASDTVDGHVLLAIRFTTDDYINVAGHDNFRHGRLVGCLAPGKRTEPIHACGARQLSARPMPDTAAWYVPWLQDAVFKVDEARGTLTIDLSNSLCMETPGGPPMNLGEVRAIAKAPGGEVDLGAVDTSGFTYMHAAAITEIALDREELDAIRESPLVLRTSREDIGPRDLWSEDKSGLAFTFDHRVLRMTPEPGSELNSRSTRVHVTRWGKPAADVQFGVSVIPVEGAASAHPTPGQTGTPWSPGDTWEALGVLETDMAPSDSDGFATLTLRAVKNPSSRTSQLDGQIYFITCHPAQEPDAAATQGRQLSVLVWSHHEVLAEPTWEDVVEIMTPYAKLYPSMTELIDLTDPAAFEIFSNNPPWKVYGEAPDYSAEGLSAGAIPYFMTRDIEDPRYMPITRDLSPNKTATVLNWIRNQAPKPHAASEASSPKQGDR